MDGIWTTSQHKDESQRHTVDWDGELASGETISSSSWEASGVTVTGAGNGSTTTYATVTGTNGTATNTVVTTGGAVARTLVRKLRFISPDEDRPARHYV